MNDKSFQDYYPESLSHCYGCGKNNPHGLHIRSFWDGEESVAVFQPREYHLAFPGYVYGGLLASLIDCHCVGTAAAAAYRAEGRELGTLAGLSLCHRLAAGRLSQTDPAGAAHRDPGQGRGDQGTQDHRHRHGLGRTGDLRERTGDCGADTRASGAGKGVMTER